MDGLLQSLEEVIGVNARPTPIQALSLKHLFKDPFGESPWREYLLASETGSGKSVAYLLPMLQALKLSENDVAIQDEENRPKYPINPRAIVLAPTHELSRQLSTFAKALLHNAKLRVLCASRTNIPGTQRNAGTASQMARNFGEINEDGSFMHASPKQRLLDVLVGTPNKILEMIKGRGWDWEKRVAERTPVLDDVPQKTRTKWAPPRPEMGLSRVEWVVVDEADVLFGNSYSLTLLRC